MSSYLSFYLVPKKTKKKYSFSPEGGEKEEEIEISKGVPLLLMCYSRNNEIYQAYNDTLNPAYCGMEEKYTELTYEDAKRVVSEYESDVKSTEKRLEVTYKMLKEGGYHEDLFSEIQSSERYLEEQKETLEELKFIANLVYEATRSWTNFEKVLINVD